MRRFLLLTFKEIRIIMSCDVDYSIVREAVLSLEMDLIFPLFFRHVHIGIHPLQECC
jgi:hypothetical protein